MPALTSQILPLPEANRYCIIDVHRFSILFSRFPARHKVYHPEGFAVASRALGNSLHHFRIADQPGAVDNEFDEAAPAIIAVQRYFRVPDTIGEELHERVRTARKFRHLFHRYKSLRCFGVLV